MKEYGIVNDSNEVFQLGIIEIRNIYDILIDIDVSTK